MRDKNFFRGNADMLAFADEWHAKRAPKAEPAAHAALVETPSRARPLRSSDDGPSLMLPLAIIGMGLLNL